MIKKISRFFRHYFIPHESNNYKAKSLHYSAIALYIVLLLLMQGSRSFVRRLDPRILGYATNITLERILELVNKKRLEANLQPLVISPELSTAANQKAGDMFDKNYWAHISPTGTTPWYFITQAGYEYVYAGENLAKSFDTADEVVAAWMNSPTHRANILKPEYTEIGLAVMNGKLSGEETTLVVQEFGTKTKAAAQANPPSKTFGIGSNQLGEAVPGTLSALSGIIEKTDKPLIPFKLTKTFSFLLAEFLLVILFIDSIFIVKNKTYRVSGHSLAHFIFLAALVGAMSITGAGVIL